VANGTSHCLASCSCWSPPGCATLPDVGDIIYGPLDFPPTVVDTRGKLSPEQSKRIVERLRRQPGSTDLLMRQATVMEEISGSPLIAGNKATLLKDAEATYGAMFKAIQSFETISTFETFIFEDDDIGRRFADLLLEKQQQGYAPREECSDRYVTGKGGSYGQGSLKKKSISAHPSQQDVQLRV